VIVGAGSHIHLYEQGGISTLGGVYSHVLPSESDGTLCLTKVEDAIRKPFDFHYPVTQLICIENTHGRFVLKLANSVVTVLISSSLCRCF
jgi:threonine aldolase